MSEYLYDVLSNATLQKNAVPVLVVLNKNDLPTAQPIDRVQSSLQSELSVPTAPPQDHTPLHMADLRGGRARCRGDGLSNTLRKTRSAAPDRQDDAGRGGTGLFPPWRGRRRLRLPCGGLKRPLRGPWLSSWAGRAAGDQTSAFLGYDNKTFEFSDLENEVSFVECSAKTGADSLRPIEIWLRNQYPLAGGRAGFVFSN